MKLSKACKARIDMMTAAEKKALAKCARVMAETECITHERAKTVIKWCGRSSGGY